MAGDHSIWSFCFARGRLPADFCGGCPVCSNQGLVEVPMHYTLVASAPAAERRRLILVDTGLASGVSMTGRAFANLETLAKACFRPEDVDTVILTHLHHDHAGNIAAFPKARIVC